MTRREFFSNLIPARRDRSTLATVVVPPDHDHPTIAVIAGRHCLAYQGTFCSTCRERCPVAGAIIFERGLPRVNPGLCNGCRICHEVCPAPTNAVRLIGRARFPTASRSGKCASPTVHHV